MKECMNKWLTGKLAGSKNEQINKWLETRLAGW
jgi:hypothetical protein